MLYSAIAQKKEINEHKFSHFLFAWNILLISKCIPKRSIFQSILLG